MLRRARFQALVPPGATEVDQILTIAKSDWARSAARGWTNKIAQFGGIPQQEAEKFENRMRIVYAAGFVKATPKATEEALTRLEGRVPPVPTPTPTPTPAPTPAPAETPRERAARRRGRPPGPAAPPPPPPTAPPAPQVLVDRTLAIVPARGFVDRASLVSDAQRVGVPNPNAIVDYLIAVGTIEQRGRLVRRKAPEPAK